MMDEKNIIYCNLIAIIATGKVKGGTLYPENNH